MIEKTTVVGSFQCNCKLLACSRTGEALLIDPGDEPEEILKTLAETHLPSGAPLRLRYLLHTHAHLDHIGGTRAVREKLISQSPLISLHRDDEMLYQNLKMQGRLFGMECDDPLPIEHYLQDEEDLRIGDLRISVIHTPGHSPGSVCLRLHEASGTGARETLYSGDTLFQGDIGRTDLWGGDSDQIVKSIQTRLFTLDEDTRVCPGHGPDTAIGIEKRQNPYVR